MMRLLKKVLKLIQISLKNDRLRKAEILNNDKKDSLIHTKIQTKA